MRDSEQVPGDGALVADAIVDVCETEAVNLGDVEVRLQILQAAVESRDVHSMSLGDEVG